MNEPRHRQRRKELTDKQVIALPKKRKRYAVPDPEERGHFIRVMPNSANVFVVVARSPLGKQVWHTIGSADAMTIAEAREQAREARKRIAKGLPPVEPPPPVEDSFESVAADWLKRHVERNGFRSAGEVRRVLETLVLPHWGDRPFVELRRSDITALLDKIEDENGPSAADHVLSITRAIANWYSARHDNYVPPFVRRMARTKPEQRKRSRILSDQELAAVWREAEGAGTFGALVRFLLFSGQRCGVTLAMKWADVDLDAAVWRIPAEPRAKGNAGELKLPEMAMEIIRAQPRMMSNEHVFASGRGSGPIGGLSKAKRLLHAACGVDGWTLHDLRRQARSLMGEAGVLPHVAERVLGHRIPGVEGIYDRASYAEQKADALERLAARIASIVTPPPENVLPLKKRARRPVTVPS